jgi:hypothetical protein
LLQAAQFSIENCFAASTSISIVNATLLQPTHFRQRMLIRCRELNFGSKSQIHYRQLNFGNECGFAAENTLSVANADSLQTTQFQQRTRICCSTISAVNVDCDQHNFGSEH